MHSLHCLREILSLSCLNLSHSQPDILKLARARRLIDFEGSVLVMPQHKDVVISIVDSQSVRLELRFGIIVLVVSLLESIQIDARWYFIGIESTQQSRRSSTEKI